MHDRVNKIWMKRLVWRIAFMKWWHFDLSKRSSKEVSRSKGSEPRECTRDTEGEVSGKKGWSAGFKATAASRRKEASIWPLVHFNDLWGCEFCLLASHSGRDEQGYGGWGIISSRVPWMFKSYHQGGYKSQSRPSSWTRVFSRNRMPWGKGEGLPPPSTTKPGRPHVSMWSLTQGITQIFPFQLNQTIFFPFSPFPGCL